MSKALTQESWTTARPLIEKVLSRINIFSEAKEVFMGYAHIKKFEISYMNFSAAAGNHAFDDKPEVFGITKNEGHKIREYFQYDGRGEEIPENKKDFEKMVETEGFSRFD